jgi:hypothetical protein
MLWRFTMNGKLIQKGGWKIRYAKKNAGFSQRENRRLTILKRDRV